MPTRIPSLFDQDHSILWPSQQRFPLNEPMQGLYVKNTLNTDIAKSSSFIIITGFTSLANLVRYFGAQDLRDLKKVRVVFGFEPDERLSKRQVDYNLSTEVKNYWLKRNVSILLCGPILNLIEKIKDGKILVKSIDKLHAKIYAGDDHAMLGSSNFSISGLEKLREANIRVPRNGTDSEASQYNDIKQIAENYFELGIDYTQELIALLTTLLKDATWQEALARSLAEVLESKWIADYPVLYQAIMSNELWPTQRIGIGRAMSLIQEQGNLLIADPTGSGKTKMTTALAYIVFHWMYQNGLTKKSNAFIVAPPQVIPNWRAEEKYFSLFNRIESTGKLSFGSHIERAAVAKDIEAADILIIDEAHNFLNPGTNRSKAIVPRAGTHVILSTATPINKKAEDLLRLIELLDIDNLSDEDLASYLSLRKEIRRKQSVVHIKKLQKYINQFILRRTKRELNAMIDWDEKAYVNKNGRCCRYPKSIAETYPTDETKGDKEIAKEISVLLRSIKGINYLSDLKFPNYCKTFEEKRQYLKQRFNSAPALAGFEIRSALRSSHCALFESLYGTAKAEDHYGFKTAKKHSGSLIEKLKKLQAPQIDFEIDLLATDNEWIVEKESFNRELNSEIHVYEQIGELVKKLSGKRELTKANLLVQKAIEYGKILAFDSTVITLDYLAKLIAEQKVDYKVIVATGSNDKKKKEVRESFDASVMSGEKIIGLCSDAMAEGINLQGGKAIVLLDIPSVLRIIEQRIGRIERMDSDHKEIHVYWPEDSEEFSLKGDQRMIDILVMTDNLIKGNVEIPQKGVYEKYYKSSLSTKGLITALEEFSAGDQEWEGITDTTQCLFDLIEGPEALISRKVYNQFKDVTESVKTAVSFVESDAQWSFFAFRGDAKRSPKWLFIDEKKKATTDFARISELLVEHLKDKRVVQKKWQEVQTDEEIKRVVRQLHRQETNLLPAKKRRALTKASALLATFAGIVSNDSDRDIIYKLQEFLQPNHEENRFLNMSHFADLWLQILVPAVQRKREAQKRRSTVITIDSLKFEDVKLTTSMLRYVYDNCEYANSLDEIIAACIIAVKR